LGHRRSRWRCGNFPGANGEVRYREGLLTGYRWYDSRQLEVAFPFGHGLSYTEFEIGLPSVTIGQTVIVEAEVRNIGDRKGVEVVQLYACVLPTRPWPLTNMSSMSAPACGPKPPTTSQHPIQENPMSYVRRKPW